MTIERPMFPRHNAKETKTYQSCYMELESQVLDLDRIAQLSFLAAQQEDMELMHFCISRTAEMAAQLHKDYAAGYASAREG